MTDNRIKECKDMINIIKSNARSVPAVKQRTVIKSVSLASYLFVLDETLSILNTLEAENKRLSRDLRDLQNFCINFAADQTAKAIDFPNSINYQLADYESDFPGENPEDIF